MKIHRALLLEDKKPIAEIRFSNGLLYKQNRSYDKEMSFDCFIDLLTKSQKQAKERGQYLEYTVLDKDCRWEA